MVTCKDCEHSQPESNFPTGEKMIRCGKSGSRNFAVRERQCFSFTPKKPKEEKISNPRYSRLEEAKERDYEAHVRLLNARLRRQKEVYRQKEIAMRKQLEYLRKVQLGAMQKAVCPPNDKKEITTPKRKEPKMKLRKLIFWPIRRYVATCVVLVTAKICIWLNPYLFWVVDLFGLDWIPNREGEQVSSTSPVQIAFFWMLAIMAIAVIIFALWLYNQFCKRLCKMIGSE